MKKIFTLLTVAMMALNVSAKEEVGALNPWSESVKVDGTTWTIPGGWQGAGAVVEGEDKTAFDYVYIKYSNATGSPNFGIVYNEWLKKESWGDSYATVTAAIPDGSGIVGIKLDKETVMVKGSAETDGVGIGDVYAQHVKQIQIQSGNNAATVTIEGIYFGTTAEFVADGGDVPVRPAPGESLVIWQGSVNFDSWSATTTVDAKYFEVAEVGDIIRCNITDAADPNPVFKNVGDWSDLVDVQNTRVINATNFEGTIATEEALTTLRKNGLRLQGVGFVLTSIELIANTATGINNVAAEKVSNDVIFNVAGQRVNNNYKGVVVKNGKKFIQK